jgi:predicted phage terminase large subunit-like protein
MPSSQTKRLEGSPEISSDELLLLAQSSPAGFAWVTSLRHPQTEAPTLPGRGELAEGPSPPQELSRFWLPAHIDYLNDCLMRLAAREYLRQGYFGLIIEMPPRHGKSELCSHYDSAWYLGAFPDHRVMLASYEADFAASWGRRARDTLEEWGAPIFGVAVNKRSSAADRWDLLGHRGGMATAGVGGAFTGRGADYLKIDDPIKNAAQAQSKSFRDSQWEWYRSTARTRVEPDGIALVVATRWHEDDLIGRLLAAAENEENADQWIVIRFPAIAEEEDVLGRAIGDALWRERYDEKALATIRATVGPYVWGALFQQSPAPKSGGIFEREWLEANILDGPPNPIELKKVVRYWDFASTDAKAAADPDYTVGAKVALNDHGQLVILDVQRSRKSPGDVERLVQQTTELDGRGVKVRIEQEKGSAGKHVVSYYGRRVLPGRDVKGDPVSGSKTLRADPVSAYAQRGDLKLVRGSWNASLIEEFEQFPFGTHDDQVDAVSGAASELLGKGGKLVSW